MLNEMIVAAITSFSGTTTPDKNGAAPVMLQCIAGTMPNRNVLAGTVAQRAGLEVGKTYLVNVRETGFDELFGPDYTFIKIMELTSGLDIVRAAKELGDARIMYVLRPDHENFAKAYQRKGNAVESSRTKRIREGHYHPSIQTSTIHHETAAEVVDGTSVGSGGRILIKETPKKPDEGEPNISTRGSSSRAAGTSGRTATKQAAKSAPRKSATKSASKSARPRSTGGSTPPATE